ncbi:MAG TPA: hypothetical protein VIK65_12520 [Candidatus Limnocylindrales bacterium]
MIDLGRSCSRHRPALVDFVDHGEVRSETAAALVHLDRCERCMEAIESTVLTITALRRYAGSLDAVDPAPDAWPRLAARVTTWRRRPVSMSPLSGLAMSVAVVVALVLPFRLGPSDLAGAAGSAAPSRAHAAAAQPDAIRAASRRAPGSESEPIETAVGPATLSRGEAEVVVDSIRVTVKEVSLDEPAGRLARPI